MRWEKESGESFNTWSTAVDRRVIAVPVRKRSLGDRRESPRDWRPSLLPEFREVGVGVEGLGVLEGVAVLHGLPLDDPLD